MAHFGLKEFREAREGFRRLDDADDDELSALQPRPARDPTPPRPRKASFAPAAAAPIAAAAAPAAAAQAGDEELGAAGATRTPAPLARDKSRANTNPRLKAIYHAKGEEIERLGDLQRENSTKLQPEEEKKAALKIQHWYRTQVAMFAAFGPMMFSCKDGRMADFGTISFLSGSRTAKFVRVADTTSAGDLAHFLEKFWQLPRPDVVLSVTGSAASMTLTSTLQKVFDRGLATAAAMTNAWIFTGGTDSGVMKLVGEALYKYGLEVPLIGIAPWGAVQGRRALHGAKGETYNYRGGPPADTEAKLNPYHTHQILVDASAEYADGALAWGHEIEMRSKLERCYATFKGAPVVLLVVQGGIGTLDTMVSAAKQGSPLLIISDSAGAATAVHQYIKLGGVDAVTEEAFTAADVVAKLELLKRMDEEREGSLLTFFRLADDEAEESMVTAFLKCLFRNLMFYQSAKSELHDEAKAAQQRSGGGGGGGGGAAGGAPAAAGIKDISKLVEAATEVVSRRRDHMQRALLLAVKWNQIEFARRMLAELPSTEDYSRPLHKMLQHALELQRVEIVAMLLERPGCDVPSLNVCQLYLQEDPYNFLRSDLDLQARLQARLSDGTIAAPKNYETYKAVVGPFIDQVSPILHGAIEQSSAASHVDLFFWSIFIGNVPLAREIWAHVDNPLHCALLATNILAYMQSSIQWGKQEVGHFSQQLEGWAIGVMEEVDEQEIAHLILSQHVEEWRMGALVELALVLKTKAFLAHRHCQSLMDLWWRGGYSGSLCEVKAEHTLPNLATYICFPFANPYIRLRGDGLLEQQGISREEREQVLFDALANALTHSARAKLAATTMGRAPYAAPNGITPVQARSRRASVILSTAPGELAGGSTTTTTTTTTSSSPPRRAPNAREAHRGGKAGGDHKGGGGHGEGGGGGVGSGGSKKEVHFDVSNVPVDPKQSYALQTRTRTLRQLSRSGTRLNILHAMHEKEEKKREAEAARGGTLGALHEFYSVPLVKFLLRAMWHVLFLVLFTEVLTHLHTAEQLAAIAPRLPPIDLYEKLFIVWALTLYYENRQRKVSLKQFGLSTEHLPFQKATTLGHSLLALAIVLRLGSMVPLDAYIDVGGMSDWLPAFQGSCYVAYQRLLSFDAVLVCVELFTFMWVSRDFGVLAIIMGQMLVDLSLFLVFALVLLLGFSAALLGLSETASIHDEDGSPILGGGGSAGRALHRHNGGAGGEAQLPLLAVPLWAMFTDLEIGQLLPIPFAPPLMLAYVLLANVVLVNLLIAMFADTYSRIKQNAEVEYHYQRFLHIFEYIHVVHATPPPFSIPFLVYDFFEELRETCTRRVRGHNVEGLTAAEALHRVAAERPTQLFMGGSTTGTSKKYVQSFLKERDGEGGSAMTNFAMYKKVEALLASMDERVHNQLERLDTQISPAENEQVKAMLQLLVSRSESKASGGGGINPMRSAAAIAAGQKSLFASMLGTGYRQPESSAAAAPPSGAAAYNA